MTYLVEHAITQVTDDELLIPGGLGSAPPDLRVRTSASPFAKAFFTLAEELGIVPRAGSDAPAEGTPARARVRVVEGG